MHPIHMLMLRQSYEMFQPCGPALIAGVVRRLGDDHPDVRGLLPDDTSDMHEVWFKTLGQIIRKADRFSTMEKALGALGEQAAAVGANVRDYEIVRSELLGAMAQLAGEDWTPELARAWGLLLEAVTGAMLAGGISPRLAA
jgi:hemoglobin-like flavoprotein